MCLLFNDFNIFFFVFQINKKIYNDSTIAKNVTCGRTKVEAIVNNVIGPYTLELTLQGTNKVSFIGVATDASNHNAVKMFPVVIQYFDFKNGGIQTKLLDIKSAPNETSETISDLILDVLRKNDLQKKCIAFSGDNCNTNFGGIDRKGQNNVFIKLKSKVNQNLVGVGCPSHVINNAVHYSCDKLKVDLESIVLKIFNYFSIYTVRVESLKEFCEFVDTEYAILLYHSKTRWLSLFPAIERVLKMFEALKSYFLSQTNPPYILKSFFENDFSEAYLFFVHSLMSIFHTNIERIERQDNSVVETMSILENVLSTLEERAANKFIPLKVSDILRKCYENGLDRECDLLKLEFYDLYENSIKYLKNWLKPFKEFQCFKWISLKFVESYDWERDVMPSLLYLIEKGVEIDDAKFFDQFSNLKKYIQDNFDANDHSLPAHEKFTKYFKASISEEVFSELLKAAEFVFAIPSHNANVERIFSLIAAQWTKERNRLLLSSIKGILMTTYNLRNMSCVQFYDFILLPENLKLLNKIQSSEKYL